MDWKLTDEEIYDAANPNIEPHYKRHWKEMGYRVSKEDRAIADAAVRKVVEAHEKAIHGECPLPTGGDDAFAKVTHCHAQVSCRYCKSDYFLKALKQEVGL